MRAIQAACKIADDPARVVPVVRDLLDDPEKSVRWFASEGFRDMGPAARAAAPDLYSRCPVRVSQSLILSVKQFRDQLDTFVPQVIACLSDEDEEARQIAAKWLRGRGRRATRLYRRPCRTQTRGSREAARYGLDAVIE